MPTPLIALTMGDPAGIGPEIVLKAAARRDVRAACVPVVFGDAAWLARTLPILPKGHAARRLVIAVVHDVSEARRIGRGSLAVMNVASVPARGVRVGTPSAAAGRVSGEAIVAAVAAVRKGEAAALVTAPINKLSFSLSGWGERFVGHTEMLSSLTKVKDARLMLVHGHLRAVHVTSHIPLARVPGALSARRILETIRVTHAGLRGLGLRAPRIAVCGLNPHAGDGGVLGDEEARLIAPAVKAARRAGIAAFGPLPADTVWPHVLAKRYDAGVAMYHDQGQIPVKLLGIDGAVNVTLGLPIIRTSPGHGTAFDIAGKGVASEESLVAAIRLAARMASESR